jgi:hypothetical protein
MFRKINQLLHDYFDMYVAFPNAMDRILMDRALLGIPERSKTGARLSPKPWPKPSPIFEATMKIAHLSLHALSSRDKWRRLSLGTNSLPATAAR